MKYDTSQVKEIIPRLASVWLVESGRTKKLLVLDKEFTIERVVEMLKAHGARRFVVSIVDVGEFNLDQDKPIENSYSSDGRGVDQDMNIVL